MNRRLYLLLALAIVALTIACGTPPEAPASAVDDVESSTSGAIDVDGAADSDSDAVAEEAEEAEMADEAESEEMAEEATEEEAAEEMAEEAAEEEMADEEMADEEESTSMAEGDDVFPALTPEDAIAERSFDHAKGSNDPAVVVIEYGDFQ